MPSAGDERALEVANDEFHAVINRGAESPRLAWFYAEAIPIVPRRFLTLVPGWIDGTRREHRIVVERLRERDADGARGAMSAHIRHVGELVADHFDAGGAWPPGPRRGHRGTCLSRCQRALLSVRAVAGGPGENDSSVHAASRTSGATAEASGADLTTKERADDRD